jgi:hypothetical protein
VRQRRALRDARDGAVQARGAPKMRGGQVKTYTVPSRASLSRKPVVRDRAELPGTYLIVSSLEERFAEILSTRAVENMEALLHSEDRLAQRMRAQHHERGRALLRTRQGKDALAGAAKRLTDVDLDVAWQAALRGDRDVLEARVLPCLDVRPSRRTSTPRASPWRASGWLRGRAR